MTQFQDKYRIESTRWIEWDYSQSGPYFVTICTARMACCLGNIVSRSVKLSRWGVIVQEEWLRTPEIRPGISLDVFAIMPNHFHAIIAIANESKGLGSLVETHSNASSDLESRNRFGPQQRNLASAIRGFKGAAARRIHSAGFSDFAWQARFYDHVIRNEKALDEIREYILENPVKWESDRENPEGLFC